MLTQEDRFIYEINVGSYEFCERAFILSCSVIFYKCILYEGVLISLNVRLMVIVNFSNWSSFTAQSLIN